MQELFNIFFNNRRTALLFFLSCLILITTYETNKQATYLLMKHSCTSQVLTDSRHKITIMFIVFIRGPMK
jgi:hypothetical protein